MAARDESKKAKETLEEIESLFDRGANWVSENPRTVLVVISGVLLLTASIAATQWYLRSQRLAASEAVGLVQAEYLDEMGGGPLQPEVVEPANPETALETRTEYAGRLLESAAQYSDSAAAVLGRIEAGVLRSEAEDEAGAEAAWRSGLADAPPGPLRAALLVRLAAEVEDSDPAEASLWYEEAGRSEGFAHARRALAHAARSAADAGDTQRALELFAEVEAQVEEEEEADLRPVAGASVPDYVMARLRELKLGGEGKDWQAEITRTAAPAPAPIQISPQLSPAQTFEISSGGDSDSGGDSGDFIEVQPATPEADDAAAEVAGDAAPGAGDAGDAAGDAGDAESGDAAAGANDVAGEQADAASDADADAADAAGEPDAAGAGSDAGDAADGEQR